MSIHAHAGKTLRLSGALVSRPSPTPALSDRVVTTRPSAEHQPEWHSDKQAWRYLSWRGWAARNAVLIPPPRRPAKISAKEWRAAQYLVDEANWRCAPVME